MVTDNVPVITVPLLLVPPSVTRKPLVAATAAAVSEQFATSVVSFDDPGTIVHDTEVVAVVWNPAVVSYKVTAVAPAKPLAAEIVTWTELGLRGIVSGLGDTVAVAETVTDCVPVVPPGVVTVTVRAPVLAAAVKAQVAVTELSDATVTFVQAGVAHNVPVQVWNVAAVAPVR